MAYPTGRPQSKESNLKRSKSHKASKKSALNRADVRDKGREAQHAIKHETGVSLSGHNSGMATADRLGRTPAGKSVEALRRIHLRWDSPVKDAFARKVLDEHGLLDEDGRPLRCDN